MQKHLNLVQEKAYELIKSDARFIRSIILNSEKINSNCITMFSPYLGVFSDGAEQWGRKTKRKAPVFSNDEKKHYTIMRQSIKLFDMKFDEFYNLLNMSFYKSDEYFANVCKSLGKYLKLYNNVGCDLQETSFLGNTVLGSVFLPFYEFEDINYEEYIRKISVIAGKLCATYDCKSLPTYKINNAINFEMKDYHFFARCPLKNKDFKDFCLFCILCNVNFVRIFIEQYFLEECPSKLRFAYLQYYYLAELIPEINSKLSTNFLIDDKFKNREFRNCMAHYGLRAVMDESDIVESDLMFGLTNKIFKIPYIEIKTIIFAELDKLAHQLELQLF